MYTYNIIFLTASSSFLYIQKKSYLNISIINKILEHLIKTVDVSKLFKTSSNILRKYIIIRNFQYYFTMTKRIISMDRISKYFPKNR